MYVAFNSTEGETTQKRPALKDGTGDMEFGTNIASTSRNGCIEKITLEEGVFWQPSLKHMLARKLLNGEVTEFKSVDNVRKTPLMRLPGRNTTCQLIISV